MKNQLTPLSIPIPKAIEVLARRNGASRGSVFTYLTDDERKFQQSQKFKREGYIDAWVKKSVPSMATKRLRFTLRWHQKARARQRIDFTNPQIG